MEFLAPGQELSDACQFDPHLTLHMVDSFMEGGGEQNEDCKFPLCGLKTSLNKKLLEIACLPTCDKQEKAMIKMALTSSPSAIKPPMSVESSLMSTGLWPNIPQMQRHL